MDKLDIQGSVGYVSPMSKQSAIHNYCHSGKSVNYGVPGLRAVSKLSSSLMQTQLSTKVLESMSGHAPSTFRSPLDLKGCENPYVIVVGNGGETTGRFYPAGVVTWRTHKGYLAE